MEADTPAHVATSAAEQSAAVSHQVELLQQQQDHQQEDQQQNQQEQANEQQQQQHLSLHEAVEVEVRVRNITRYADIVNCKVSGVAGHTQTAWQPCLFVPSPALLSSTLCVQARA